MNTYDVIRGKRDTKLLDSRPVPEATLRRILQAGRMAGSAKHSQPCRFVVVEEPEQRRALAACGDFTLHLVSAPLVIAIVVLPGSGQWDPERAVQFDAGRAAQNMMLAAWAEGVSSCPNTMHRNEEAARLLALPEGSRIAQVLLFGYPAGSDNSRPQRPRLPFEEYVHWNRWGERR